MAQGKEKQFIYALYILCTLLLSLSCFLSLSLSLSLSLIFRRNGGSFVWTMKPKTESHSRETTFEMKLKPPALMSCASHNASLVLQSYTCLRIVSHAASLRDLLLYCEWIPDISQPKCQRENEYNGLLLSLIFFFMTLGNRWGRY